MTLIDSLARLESAQLIRRGEGLDPSLSGQIVEYHFKHSLTQETAYESLLLKRRREIHRRVAVAIERLYAESLDDSAALLAQHYCEAGDDDKTLEYSIRAGDLAMRIYANIEAVQEFSLAMDVAKRRNGADCTTLKSLYLKRGRALELLSRFDDAASNYDEMDLAAEASGNREFKLAALIAKATIRAIPGSARDPVQARALADQALSLARELGDRKAEAKTLWSLLLLDVYSDGDAREAVSFGEQSLAIAREFNLREQMAYTLQDLFVAYSYLGDLQKARSVREEAGDIWRELDNQPMLAECLSGLSLLEFMSGDPSKAITLGLQASRISQTIGNVGGQGFSGYTLGLIYAEVGQFDRAIKSLEEAIPITLSGGMEGNGIGPVGMIGLIHAFLGDYIGARALLRSAFQRASAKLPMQRLWLSSLLTRVELLAGDLDAAKTASREGPVVASLENYGRMFPMSAPQPYLSMCELRLAEGEPAEALKVIDELISHLGEMKVTVFGPEALFLKGQALMLLRNRAEAGELWRAARTEATTISGRRMLLRILRALSRLEDETGNHAEAVMLQAEAEKTAEHIFANSPEGLRQSFVDVTGMRVAQKQ